MSKFNDGGSDKVVSCAQAGPKLDWSVMASLSFMQKIILASDCWVPTATYTR